MQITQRMGVRASRIGLVCSLLFSLVAGCGGSKIPSTGFSGGTGGGGGAGGAGGETEVGGRGVLVPAVSGLRYETETTAGETDADGGFDYEAGETVTFSVGGTVLGSANAKSKVDLFDLVPDADVTTDDLAIQTALLSSNASALEHVMNIATFLSSLDLDGDSRNGIQITGTLAALFDGVEVDFRQDWFRFRNDADMRRALESFDEPRAVVSAFQAMGDFYRALDVSLDARRTTSRVREYAGSPPERATWEYDEAGRPLYFDDGGINSRRLEYDERGNHVAEESLYQGGDRTVYTYDEHGDLLRRDHTFGSGSTVRTHVPELRRELPDGRRRRASRRRAPFAAHRLSRSIGQRDAARDCGARGVAIRC